MKMNIYETNGIELMQRSEKLEPGKLFLIGSESVTNSFYFHRKEDLIYAHKVVNQKLSGILIVIDYLFTPQGWLLLVKFKTRKKIQEYYSRLQSLKEKENSIKSAEEIISEIIRLAISSIAAFVNRGVKRKGALVQKVFKRFKIETLEVALSIINKMKKREIILSNQRNHFIANFIKLKIKALKSAGMCFLSSEVLSVSQNSITIKFVRSEENIKAKLKAFISGAILYKSLKYSS